MRGRRWFGNRTGGNLRDTIGGGFFFVRLPDERVVTRVADVAAGAIR